MDGEGGEGERRLIDLLASPQVKIKGVRIQVCVHCYALDTRAVIILMLDRIQIRIEAIFGHLAIPIPTPLHMDPYPLKDPNIMLKLLPNSKIFKQFHQCDWLITL